MVAIDLAVDVAVAKFPGVSAIDWVPQALVVGLAIDPVADKAVGVPAIDLVADKVVEEAVGVPATDPAVDRVADKAVGDNKAELIAFCVAYSPFPIA